MEHFKIPDGGYPRRRSGVSAAAGGPTLKPPTEVPYDTEGGEIVGILPYTFGPREKLLYEKAQKMKNPDEMTDAELADVAINYARAEQSAVVQSPTVAAAAAALQVHGDVCPKCTHPSIQIMKNIVPGTQVCFGIPTCMNVLCMFMSPKIFPLPMPRMTSYPVNREEILKGRDFENPHRDEVLKSYLELGVYLKNNPSKPPLPIDKKAVEYYRNADDETFEQVIKDAFDGEVPKIPGIHCLEDGPEEEEEQAQVKTERMSNDLNVEGNHSDAVEKQEVVGVKLLDSDDEETQEVADNADDKETQEVANNEDDKKNLVVEDEDDEEDLVLEDEDDDGTQETEVSSEEEQDDGYNDQEGEFEELAEEDTELVDLADSD